MRFSLTTLILAMLCIALWMLVWARQLPWIMTTNASANSMTGKTHHSPDNTRSVLIRNKVAYITIATGLTDEALPDDVRFLRDAGGRIRIATPPSDGKLLTNFAVGQRIELPFIPNRGMFIDDSTILFVGQNTEVGIELQAVYRRRFPEWWWGHFYRPEVWLALLLTVVLLWRARRAYFSAASTVATMRNP